MPPFTASFMANNKHYQLPNHRYIYEEISIFNINYTWDAM